MLRFSFFLAMAHYDGSMTCCAIRLETVEQKQTNKNKNIMRWLKMLRVFLSDQGNKSYIKHVGEPD